MKTITTYGEAFALLPAPPYIPDSPPPGWLQIVARMCERLASTSPPPVLAQVKEKFGSLRVYHDGVTDEQKAIIDEAIDEASRTCEACSLSGTARRHCGVVRVLCDGCLQETSP